MTVKQTFLIGDRKRGRAPSLSKEDQVSLVARYMASTESPEVIASAFGITKQTLYNYLDRAGICRRNEETPTAGTDEATTARPETTNHQGKPNPDSTTSQVPDSKKKAS